jgi:hypothetical protein
VRSREEGSRRIDPKAVGAFGVEGIVHHYRNIPRLFLNPFLPGALFAVGVVFRLLHLADPIRYDEAFTFLNYAGGPLWEALTDYRAANNHFLNTLLVRLAAHVLGEQAALWRLPNLLAGLGTLIWAGVIAKKWFGRGAGVVALAVTCVSPVMAHFSVLARGYGLSLFFGLTALYFVDVRHERKAGGLPLIGAWLSCALACYAVPTALLFVAAVFAYDAYRTYRRRARAATLLPLWAPAALLTALPYLPALIGTGPRAFFASAGGAFEAPLSLAGLRPYGAALLDAKTWGPGGGWFWLPLAAVGLVVGAVKRPAYGVLAAVAVGAAVVLLGAGYRPPARVFLYLLPVVSFGIGAAAEALWERLRSRVSVSRAFGVALLVAAAAAVVVAERGRYLSSSARAGAAPAALPILDYVTENHAGNIYVITKTPLNYALMYYVEHSPCREVTVVTGRSPNAFTYEALVAVPAGEPLREVVWEGTGRTGVVLRAAFVIRICDVGIWRALIASPDAAATGAVTK